MPNKRSRRERRRGEGIRRLLPGRANEDKALGLLSEKSLERFQPLPSFCAAPAAPGSAHAADMSALNIFDSKGSGIDYRQKRGVHCSYGSVFTVFVWHWA